MADDNRLPTNQSQLDIEAVLQDVKNAIANLNFILNAQNIAYDSNTSVKNKIDELNEKFDNTVKTLSGYAPLDLNNCENGKVYWVNNNSGNVQHAPSQNAFHIFTFLTIPNYGFQMAIQYTSNQIYVRTVAEGSWGNWKSVTLS